jgi:hypothetical protein
VSQGRHTSTHIKFKHVTDGFPIQFKAVKRLIMSDDFWDTLEVVTQVLQPALVALRYCDGMKGGTLALLYSLLLELDTTYSKPIQGLDENIRTKLHNVFMSRWSAFHAPVHSAAFAMDRQFCRRDMDGDVKKDVWSVMEDFSKAPGGKDLSKMKAQYEMFVDAVGSKQVTV